MPMIYTVIRDKPLISMQSLNSYKDVYRTRSYANMKNDAYLFQ